MKIDRRTFLKDAGILVAGLGLGSGFLPKFADALESMASGRAPIIWLQGQACSGCSVSLLNADMPGPVDLITRYLSLYFHPTLSAATGNSARTALESALNTKGYILAIEGSIPLGLPEACVVGEENFSELFYRAAKNAASIISVGTCASFGGVPAAPPNLSGAVGAGEALERNNIVKPVINLPGCPAHPAWIVGNIVRVLSAGIPDLDERNRPRMNYGSLLHEQCPYFARYQAQKFAKAPGEDGCLFKLGCQGVVTHADCSLRGWNSGVNWCIKGRAVCAGCARPEFASDPSFPFYRLNEES